MYGLLVDLLALFQSRQLAEARRAVRAFADKGAPCRGELQHPQRVSRRGRVENDVVVVPLNLRIGDEVGKGVERRDLHRAGAGQLLFHVLYDALGQFAAVGAYDAPAVFGGGLLRVEVYDRQPRRLGDRRAVSVQCLPEHILQVGCGIGADQEDFIAPVGQPDGGCAGDRGLAYAAFAREKEVFRSCYRR